MWSIGQVAFGRFLANKDIESLDCWLITFELVEPFDWFIIQLGSEWDNALIVKRIIEAVFELYGSWGQVADWAEIRKETLTKQPSVLLEKMKNAIGDIR